MNIELTLAEVRAVCNTRPRDPEDTRTILPNTSPAAFVLDDLIFVLMANDGIRATPLAARVAASRRFAALAIQAFRASPEASELPPTPV